MQQNQVEVKQTTGTHVTATYLVEFYSAETKDGVARLSVLLSSLQAASADEFRDAAKEAAKVSDTMKQRMSEARQLYGALHQVEGFQPSAGEGYHRTIAKAREALANAKINWQGKPLLDKSEKASKRAFNAKVALTAIALDKAHGDVSKIAETLPEVRREQAYADIHEAMLEAINRYNLSIDDVEAVMGKLHAETAKVKQAADKKEQADMKQAA